VEAEVSFDDEQCSTFAHARLSAVAAALLLAQRVAVRADHLALATIDRVGPYHALPAAQRVRQRWTIVHVGGGRDHRVNQLDAAVHTDVRLHVEVPLVPFLRLMHLGVALLVLILGRGRRHDNVVIDDRASAQLHPLDLQASIDRGRDCLSQLMLLQKMPEFAHRGFIRRRLATQINANGLAHRERVIQRLCRRRIRQIEPLLQEIDAQHPFQPHRSTACAFVLWIRRIDQGAQLNPRHHMVHLRERLVASRALATEFKRRRRQILLREFHRSFSPACVSRIQCESEDRSEAP